MNPPSIFISGFIDQLLNLQVETYPINKPTTSYAYKYTQSFEQIQLIVSEKKFISSIIKQRGHIFYQRPYFCRLMGQKKLIRFAEIKNFPNVLEYPAGVKGKWHSFFKNQNPLTLELACGKGEYSVGLGRLYPQRNFIGIDIKGNRIWRGAKTALEEGLTNVAFVRSQIDKVTDYFVKDEISEIWITFPDPQLRLSRMKKRLTHPRFLRLYQQFLEPDGLVHLKTDSPDLYGFTKNVINLYGLELLIDYADVYSQPNPDDELKIKTHYESLDIAQSNRIHYLRFKINNTLDTGKDEILKNMICGEEVD